MRKHLRNPARSLGHPLTTLSPAVLLALVGLCPTAFGQHCGCPHEFDCRLPDMPPEGIYQQDRLWAGGIIPYQFSANVNPADQAKARAAMDTIESVCNATFIPRTGEPDYVELESAPTSYSEWIGRKGGRQMLGILPWNARYIIVHELMHAMGAWHENQRMDRDTYITTNFANVPPNQVSNFTTRPAASPYAWYDFDSVMHYRRFHFTGTGYTTIDPKPGYERWKYRIGQVTHLSTGDIWLLTEMYGGARPPGVFDLTAPSTGAAVGAGWSPSFTWMAAQEAVDYQLLVDDDPYFRSPEIDITTTAPFHAGGSLANGKVYFWTVKARSAGGITQPWHTPVASFYTGTNVPAVLYVDDSAPVGGDGFSWASAFSDLQDALALADCAAGAPVEVRVAQGSYKPDRGSADRAASFQLRSNLFLRGGYAGYGAAEPNARSISAFPTVLSGDLAGDDEPGFVNVADNSQHVLWSVGQRWAPVSLDGFTITAGYADGQFIPTGQGGGLWADDCDIHITDCTFTSCLATLDGGAMFLQSCEGLIRGCTFTGNRSQAETATRAGALMVDNGWRELVMEQCTFADNAATRAGGAFFRFCTQAVSDSIFEANAAFLHGGAAMVIAADADFRACRFIDNSAAGAFAGGLLLGSAGSTLGSVSLINCLLSGNTAPNGGGAFSAEAGSAATFVNCTIANNVAPNPGGLYIVGQYQPPTGSPVPTSLMLANSIVYGNSGPQIFVGALSTSLVYNCNIQGGWPGPHNIDDDPQFAHPTGCEFSLASTSPCINAGDNAAVPPGIATDLCGNQRFVSSGMPAGLGVVDMGAYEFQGGTCYANCDGSTTQPILNVADFGCFLQRFAAGDPYANCDGSTTQPILNVADFGCFLQQFAAGCP